MHVVVGRNNRVVGLTRLLNKEMTGLLFVEWSY